MSVVKSPSYILLLIHECELRFSPRDRSCQYLLRSLLVLRVLDLAAEATITLPIPILISPLEVALAGRTLPELSLIVELNGIAVNEPDRRLKHVWQLAIDIHWDTGQGSDGGDTADGGLDGIVELDAETVLGFVAVTFVLLVLGDVDAALARRVALVH